MKRILIAVQARSTSKRLPAKVHLPLGGKPVLQWVIDSCNRAISYAKKDPVSRDVSIELVILVPYKDPILDMYSYKVSVLEGPEDNVLLRYIDAVEKYDPDYLVRITADCPELPAHLIFRHIKSALIQQKDFTTNCHYRTFVDGNDVQVASKRLMNWLKENATSAYDKEHVFTKIDPGLPFPFKGPDGKPSICHVLSAYDQSHIKISIDTQEEYQSAKERFNRFSAKKKQANLNGEVVW